MNSQNLHGGSGAPYGRDREIDDRHRAIQQHEDMAQREQELRDRERERERERENPDRYQTATPHHSSAGSIPIHQPVASRISTAIHSPGGLLANHNGTSQTSQSSAPMNNFGGPLQGEQARQPQQQAQQPPPPPHGAHSAQGGPNQMFASLPHTSGPPGPQAASAGSVFGGPLQQDAQRAHQQAAHAFPGINAGASQVPSGVSQGQQPILNDALTYLDQVKVQFHDQPDVYNRFLDIMKDFKSQSIDTPGVINRVSELFAGHPNLIQGFNTFLPSGYRIECGHDSNPNTIRVTTPMGTTVQSITGRGIVEHSSTAAPAQGVFPDRAGQWPPQRPQNSIESPDASFSTPAQNGASLFVQAAAQAGGFDGQRSASQMPSGGQNRGAQQTPTPQAGAAALNGAAANQANMERRGPVEFNHAISYVNKIKNRFQDKPEIYKQFLEILQTYQREQKPIQDVYAQVTTLFDAAPDLLEDFKQFLPESAAHAKAAAGRMEEAAAASAQTPTSAARDGPKMPPLGSFAPPASASKDNKKRPRADKQGQPPGPALTETAAHNRVAQNINGTKRPKISHARGDNIGIESTLTPVMPEPYPPTQTSTSTHEEIAFFDRVKKFLSNRSSMNEFLKLCNLFSQNIIDRSTLFHKGAIFIGANPDLMQFWRAFVGIDSQDVVVDNRPAPPVDKVSLSNCRGYGPSYRLLPKRERLKPCSGRDELCNSVLNDEWASHPTWASEDSGFVAHRKNQFEEGLHRIEEERHDYDFNIEANLKCIQLLEPIAQSMLAMSPEERQAFQMPAALQGQSTSIFKRICKKIYGERGIEVTNDMYANPFDVVPVLLARMKQKDEEWRFSQREWEKVWHAQTQNMHLKSLDHMGMLIKQTDKKNLTAKHLVDVIKTKHETQRRERALKGKAGRFQYNWDFSDKEIVVSVLRLLMLWVLHNGAHSTQEKERILEFLETFVPKFFDLPESMYIDKLPKIQPDSGEEEVDDATPAELTNGRSSRRNGKKGDLLRGVLDPGRNGNKNRSQSTKDDSAGSKESTPDVGSAEDELPDADETYETSNERWLPGLPKPTVSDGDNALLTAEGDLKADGFFARSWYNFFCNQTIYVFFCHFHTLYERLHGIKNSDETVSREIDRLNRPKPAREIGLMENNMNFFGPDEPKSSYWHKTLELIEDYVIGDVDETKYQDVLRHYYLTNGWRLYTITDILKALARYSITASSTDTKEKTPDLVQQYLASREKEDTSYQTEISARKFAEKCVKDGEVFVIRWSPNNSEAAVRWLQRDETTFHMDEMQLRERWQYYIASYIRMEATEGVDRTKLQKTILTRNLPSGDAESNGEDAVPKPFNYKEDLSISICLKTSKMVFAPGTAEFAVYDHQKRSEDDFKKTSMYRKNRLTEKAAQNPSWTTDLGPEVVQEKKEAFTKLVNEGPAAGGEGMQLD